MDKLTWKAYRKAPFHALRHDIVREITDLPLQTGDIFFRLSDQKVCFLPFSYIVARLTGSKYSHAGIAIIEHEEIYIKDMNDQGTVKFRLMDWLDYCRGDEIAIYRLKEYNPRVVKQLEKEIKKYLELDLDYNYTFDDPGKLYCTESVATIYKNIGIELCQPKLLKDVIGWNYYWFWPLNWLFRKLSGMGFPNNIPLYFIGDEQNGMMSSEHLELIHRYTIPVEENTKLT